MILKRQLASILPQTGQLPFNITSEYSETCWNYNSGCLVYI